MGSSKYAPLANFRRRIPAADRLNERDGLDSYSDQEAEFLRAVADWQARTGKRFPTACDYRRILMGLGYGRPNMENDE